jgi:hypothetical protein
MAGGWLFVYRPIGEVSAQNRAGTAIDWVVCDLPEWLGDRHLTWDLSVIMLRQ